MTDRLALVLSGGGAPAAYFCAGVVQSLQHHGLLDAVRVVSGTSAGALNAAVVAAGLTTDEIEEMWADASLLDLGRPRLDVWRLIKWPNLLRWPEANLVQHALDSVGWTWLVDTERPRRWLASHLVASAEGDAEGQPDGRLPIRSGLAVVVSSVDHGTGRVVRFTNERPSRPARNAGDEQPEALQASEYRAVELTVDHLLASAAVPLLLRPGCEAGREYVDAGLVANTPLPPVFDYEPDAAVVVAPANVSGSAPAPTSLGDAMGRLAENVARHALYSSYEHARTINAIVEQAPDAPVAQGKKQVDLRLIEPTMDFTVTGFLDFSPRVAAEVMQHGREQADKALGDLPFVDITAR